MGGPDWSQSHGSPETGVEASCAHGCRRHSVGDQRHRSQPSRCHATAAAGRCGSRRGGTGVGVRADVLKEFKGTEPMTRNRTVENCDNAASIPPQKPKRMRIRPHRGCQTPHRSWQRLGSSSLGGRTDQQLVASIPSPPSPLRTPCRHSPSIPDAGLHRDLFSISSHLIPF